MFKRFFTLFLLSQSILLSEVATLVVEGSGTIKETADQVTLVIGVTTEAKTAAEALEENNTRMERVRSALEGVKQFIDHMETKNFDIKPKYEQKKHINGVYYSELVGYEVNNSLSILSSKVDEVGAIIDTATYGGVNKVDGIWFSLKDRELHKRRAIDLAAKNAIADAKQLAKSMMLEVQGVSSVELDHAGGGIKPMPMLKSMDRSFAVAEMHATQIEAGDIELTAKVRVIFQISEY